MVFLLCETPCTNNAKKRSFLEVHRSLNVNVLFLLHLACALGYRIRASCIVILLNVLFTSLALLQIWHCMVIHRIRHHQRIIHHLLIHPSTAKTKMLQCIRSPRFFSIYFRHIALYSSFVSLPFSRECVCVCARLCACIWHTSKGNLSKLLFLFSFSFFFSYRTVREYSEQIKMKMN